MIRPPARKPSLLSLLPLFVALCWLAPGCSDECKSNVDCSEGQYCDTEKGVCTLDCRTDDDCPGNQKCGKGLGKCVSGTTTDSGPKPDKQVVDAGATPDVSKTDKGTPDLWPAKEAKVPDQKVVKPDQKITTPDQWIYDGPKPDMADGGGTVVPGLWTTIKAGKFFMGSPSNETCRNTNETQHEVTLAKQFTISTTEVTQAQFKQVMGYNPATGSACGTNCPVEMVNWHEAAAYCNALSKMAKLTECYTCSGKATKVSCQEGSSYMGANIYSCKGYRLPTDAEWEYAYRAGQFTALYNGKLSTCTGIDANANSIAWYNMNSKSASHPVSQKLANAWGLYDMAGNTMEWTNDWYKADLGSSSVTDPGGPTSSSSRVVRGGSWLHTASVLRAASRLSVAPTARTKYVGFRCALMP